MKVLNLYAGIGGNRKLWDDVDVTAVEIRKEVADEYQRQFPDDTVIVADAHEYLRENYDEGWDFIWSSPPCQTHSKMSKATWASDTGCNKNREPEYPDMRLYQEILFLRNFFDAEWAVENVKPYYDELIEAQEVGRHFIWSPFHIPTFTPPQKDFDFTAGSTSTQEKLESWLGIELTEQVYIGESHDPSHVLRNCVHPDLGKHVFDAATKNRQATLDI
jgi:DNA (cytosine-5)-methyltransferase 1